ncbi:MAG: 50S ribosomal protein L13 [Acidobacteriota bacterium]
MSTPFPSSKKIERSWHLVDAEGQVLGRLASTVARLLMGKHKPIFTPFLDCGDHVVVVNADKVVLTGEKMKDKWYRRHTGYPGGLKEVRARRMLREHPTRLVEIAVKGMLPKTRLGRQMRSKLRVYAGGDHPHVAQQPQSYSLTD